MQVFTPLEVTRDVPNKYLSVLVAAKYARVLNDRILPGTSSSREKKLTTEALENLASGEIKHRLVARRRT
ncbi:MAG TPA: DNA-directed RNA polymerase subunit omega [Gemmatimonadaceae bacterium]|nr:DNA-directed RNA polymerase subunit omega [Gemmatimonadaceae bacterium]